MVKSKIGGGRINYLDALKCLGILLVIEGHVRGAMGIKVYDSLSGLMFYTFDMPIFFFVSGFLAYKSQLTTKDFWSKIRQKFLYLVIPAIAFKMFNDFVVHRNFLDIINDGFKGYWFTITLFECFLIYYLLQLIVANEKLRNVTLLVLSFVGVGFLSACGEVGPKLIDLNHLTKYFQYFVFGILAMNYKPQFESLMHNDMAKTISILLFFVILILMGYDIKPTSFHHLLRDVILRYLGTFVVISFFVCHANCFDSENRINKIVLYIGRASLPIYLLQYFFIPHFAPIPMWMKELDKINVHILSFSYTLLITGVCLLFITLLSNSNVVKKYVLGQK